MADASMTTMLVARDKAGEPNGGDDLSSPPPAQTPANMVFIPGGTFRMGSDKHYPEEAPVHRVSLCESRLYPLPFPNRQFKEFVKATGHVTFAEIPPDPKDYPGALPHMIYAGSLGFSPPPSGTNLRDWSQWWQF